MKFNLLNLMANSHKVCSVAFGYQLSILSQRGIDIYDKTKSLHLLHGSMMADVLRNLFSIPLPIVAQAIPHGPEFHKQVKKRIV